jgi:outer membrane lipoprotein LolB
VRLHRGAAAWPALMLAALVGCASVAPRTAVPDALSGRMSVRIESEPPRTMSAAFELTGDAERGSLGLSTPLGTMLAQARWSPQDVTLTTPKGTSRYDDLPALTRDLLGEALPLEALFDWLRGRPWAAAPSLPTPDGFVQLDWQVTLARFDEGWIIARRLEAPAVTLRAQIAKP